MEVITRILQVCPGYFPAIGGIQDYVRNVSERLAGKHEVTVFTTDTMRLPEQEEINGVLVRRFKSFSPASAYHLSFSLLAELRRSQFDIVHGHGYNACPLFFSRYARRNRFFVSPYYIRHGVTPFRNVLIRLYKPFGKKVLQEADRLVVLSNHEKKLVMEDFQIEDDKFAIIPGGIDPKEFRAFAKLQKEYKAILYVARLDEYKGVQYAIQTLPLLEEATHLEIVGKGPYQPTLKRLATKLGIAHRVHFYQDLNRDELIYRYTNADVVLLLSRYETFGIVVAEALASKTPCIVANTSSLREWVDNENCFGVDYPINSDELAGLITEVMRKKVGEVKLWDWDEVAKQMESIYVI
ncbi:MAG: glycosyltransferase family 4 protein [Dehalococcoidales bacterium]